MAAISSDASVSWPRQAASSIPAFRTGGFPVASAIKRSSSSNSAAVVSSPATNVASGKKTERELQVHERARVAGKLYLASGQHMKGFRIPQLDAER